jgi:ferritin
MLTERMQSALNQQLNAEAYSGYLYLSMAAYFESKGLKGFARWMGMQAREEFYHTSKFYNYILERGGRVALSEIQGPPTEWSSALDVFENTLEHERKVTALINELVDLAKEERDHASDIFLQWFITEQVEEEASVEEIVQKLRLIGDGGPGLFMIDNELGQRVLSPLVAGTLTGNPVA